MKLISFSLTTPQIIARTKTVTRRVGWLRLKAGDRLQAAKKVMGRKKGEQIEKLCEIEVVSVRRERLDRLTSDLDYGFVEIEKEGLSEELRWPSSFITFFCASHKGCTPETEVTRIEFKYV